eukprot:GHVU01212140.1.p1 GENE.GHVU01212140.1~~GHVU01212140.1.p1  ORF type:complete len:187 (+),score=14.93 GHVU01212140.1:143-703(+)
MVVCVPARVSRRHVGGQCLRYDRPTGTGTHLLDNECTPRAVSGTQYSPLPTSLLPSSFLHVFLSLSRRGTQPSPPVVRTHSPPNSGTRTPSASVRSSLGIPLFLAFPVPCVVSLAATRDPSLAYLPFFRLFLLPLLIYSPFQSCFPVFLLLPSDSSSVSICCCCSSSSSSSSTSSFSSSISSSTSD